MAKVQKSRDDFSEAVKRDVRDRAASRCSNPSCCAPTVGADSSTHEGVTTIGIAAHICAAAPGGPRYHLGQSASDRARITNAIWLCANCSTLIDKNSGRNFSVELLKKWKSVAERKSANALLFGGSRVRPDWLDRIHYCQFINVPRLGAMLGTPQLAEHVGLEIGRGFRGEGMRIGAVAHGIENAICRSDIKAIPLDQLLPPSEDLVGQVVSFNHNCFTKNGVNAGQTVKDELLANFDPKRSPHFYIKAGLAKIIFPYDPAWVTTSTAFCEFSQGRARFAGIGLVKRVSDDLNEVFVSPLFVAFPQNEFMHQFYNSE